MDEYPIKYKAKAFIIDLSKSNTKIVHLPNDNIITSISWKVAAPIKGKYADTRWRGTLVEHRLIFCEDQWGEINHTDSIEPIKTLIKKGKVIKQPVIVNGPITMRIEAEDGFIKTGRIAFNIVFRPEGWGEL